MIVAGGKMCVILSAAGRCNGMLAGPRTWPVVCGPSDHCVSLLEHHSFNRSHLTDKDTLQDKEPEHFLR